MNSVPPRSCQTSWQPIFLGLWLACSLVVSAGWAAETRTPSPTPPPWQSELTTTRALQASFLLVPAKNSAEDEARRARLAEVYRQLATKYPDASLVQLAVGDGVAELESPEAALPFWKKAATLDPKNAEAADALGSVYLRANRIQEAVGEYQRAVDLRPEAAEYHSSLANMLYLFRHQLVAPPTLPDDQAVLRLALTHFRRAAELSPNSLTVAKAYAETYYAFAEPDWAQALVAWQAVSVLSGDNKDFANSHLARISVRLGQKAQAEAYLACIQDPAFNVLKASLTKQLARKMTSPKSAPTPVISR